MRSGLLDPTNGEHTFLSIQKKPFPHQVQKTAQLETLTEPLPRREGVGRFWTKKSPPPTASWDPLNNRPQGMPQKGNE